MYLIRTGRFSPAPLMVTVQPLLINWEIPPSTSARTKISLVSWIVSTDRPKGRRGIPSWNLSLVVHQLNKAPFEPIKEASLKYLTFKTVFFLALGSGKCRSEIHTWQSKNIRHQSMNPIGQRCPCIHYPAFYPRISWSGGSRQCAPSGYNNPGPLLWIDPSSLTGPLVFQLEHCATIWTGPQTSSRIRRWLFCLL